MNQQNIQKAPYQLSESIKNLREFLDLTQKELAKEAGISRNVIYHLEQKHHMPHIINLLNICNALQITPAELFAQSFPNWKTEKNSRERAELHKLLRKTMCKTITDVAVINRKE